MNNYIVYLLCHSISNNTYIGITNNKERRLRQHNGELVGGAKYTKINKKDGEWKFFSFITGDLIINRALSIEKHIKIKSRKQKGSPLEKRLKAIEIILENNPDLIFELCN